jgi:hypothetical protein
MSLRLLKDGSELSIPNLVGAPIDIRPTPKLIRSVRYTVFAHRKAERDKRRASVYSDVLLPWR